VPRPRLAIALAVTAVALTTAGCSQPEVANDNTNSQQTDRTITPPTVIRTPVRVPTAPPTVDLPGPTGGAPGEQPEITTSFSPGPNGEDGQAENDQG
jgi:hypothetical protein